MTAAGFSGGSMTSNSTTSNSTTSKYHMPTRIFSGPDCVTGNGGFFKTLGRKALLVTGANSARRNGSERDVRLALEAAGISYLVYDRIRSNPAVESVYEGAAYARQNGADFIVAIGGGSPMDAGKAIALLAAQEIGEDELFAGRYEGGALPVACVPTTAGTGSEVTPYSILTNDKAQTKTSIATELLFPAAAFLDPGYTENLPVATTVNTALDALSHAVEGMLSVKASFLSDALAAESIRMLMECMPELQNAVKQPQEPGRPETPIASGAREKLLQASLLAGMVIAQTGTTVVHAMGYSLTYFRDIDHGRANGLLLAGYLKLVEKADPGLAGRVLNVIGLSDTDRFGKLLDRLLGGKEALSPEEIRKFSGMAIQTKNMSNCIVKPEEEDLTALYAGAFA
jgi:alcohol dehydrogenase class IV